MGKRKDLQEMVIWDLKIGEPVTQDKDALMNT